MRFQPTERQAALREETRAFTREEIEPRARELDHDGTYPAEILAALGERRVTGLTLPEEYGGRGAGLVELAIVTEELSAGLMAVASSFALHLGVATVVERFGTDAQRDRFLPEMATYDTVGALGLSEDDAGSNKLEMETTATEEGDEWVLNGHKRWVTNYLNADEVLTYAKTGPETDAPHNITAFLVPADAFEVDTVWDTLGARSVKSPRVTLSDVRVPDDRRVGPVGDGYVARGAVNTGVNVPARGVGLARAALEDAVAQTTERRQYDQPISDFQGTRWTLAEMAERVETARLLTLRAADRADRGADVTREFSMAKVRATEAAVENTNESLQLHGGIGYTSRRDVERYLRDARLLTLAGGPNAGHRDTVGAAVLDDYGRPSPEE